MLLARVGGGTSDRDRFAENRCVRGLGGKPKVFLAGRLRLATQ
jgi:hypothetical protein